MVKLRTLMGINAGTIKVITMGIGLGLVAAAGTLLLPIYYLFPDIGARYPKGICHNHTGRAWFHCGGDIRRCYSRACRGFRLHLHRYGI